MPNQVGQPTTPLEGWDITIVWQPDTKDWFVTCNKTVEGDPVYTITLVAWGLESAARKLNQHIWEIENDVNAGQLILPDMGDYQVKYHK